MNAVVFEEFGTPEVLKMKQVPTPEPKPDHAIIKIRSFGINHAEMHMRRGEWAESMPIIGIECVGLVVACPGGEFAIGTPVAAVMGGLGRTINGSYAEYTSVPVGNVVKLGESEEDLKKLGLEWEQVAAIPETYATAWTVLFRNLEVKAGDRLLIRGGTSSFGRAAINLSVQTGAEVTATTRNTERFADLKSLGANEVLLEASDLSTRLLGEGRKKFDAVLELVGNSTLLDSLNLVRRGGRLCLAGFLGGLAPISDFNPLLQMASGVHFSFFGSFVFGKPEFPLSDVPLKDILGLVAENKFKAEPGRVWKFEEEDIREAHRHMEESKADGKMVVVVE
jgi:NADPH:quinone reductase-like Zn-dependent oxidoreductase